MFCCKIRSKGAEWLEGNRCDDKVVFLFLVFMVERVTLVAVLIVLAGRFGLLLDAWMIRVMILIWYGIEVGTVPAHRSKSNPRSTRNKVKLMFSA